MNIRKIILSLTSLILAAISLPSLAISGSTILKLSNESNVPLTLIPNAAGCAKWNFGPYISLPGKTSVTYTGNLATCQPTFFEFDVKFSTSGSSEAAAKVKTSSIDFICNSDIMGCTLDNPINLPMTVNEQKINVKSSDSIYPFNIIFYSIN